MSRQLLPNSTQIPDLILDEWMPLLSGSEFKVVLFVARKTYGWGRQADALALSYIAEGTGLGARTVNEVLHGTDRRKGLIERGIIHQIASDLPAGHPKAWSTFSLNLDADHSEASEATEQAPAKIRAGTHAKSAPVPAADLCDLCEKRTGTASQPMRKTQGTYAKSAGVHAADLCGNRIQQETEKHSRQETAVAEGEAEDGNEVDAAAAAAASTKPEQGQPPELGAGTASPESLASSGETTAPLPSTASPPPARASLLDLTDEQLRLRRERDPGPLVLDFRREFAAAATDTGWRNPDGVPYADLIRDKAATATRARDPLLARCIIEDWLPEIRAGLAYPPGQAPAPPSSAPSAPSASSLDAMPPRNASLDALVALQRAERERTAAAAAAATKTTSMPQGARLQ